MTAPISRWPWTTVAAPVIGMLHLPPLPGSPRSRLSHVELLRFVLADAQTLAVGGVHALMLENFGDTPFYPGRVPAETVAAMTWLAAAVRREVPLPLGINVLRNDGQSALAIAHAVGAAFIRVNVLCGARVTDQGLLTGIAHDLLRDRARLGADVQILADVNVKHSAPLAPRPLEVETKELFERAGAGGIIVTGLGTGQATSPTDVQRVAAAAGSVPVLVGSGVDTASIGSYFPHASGFIVGSSLKTDGQIDMPVDPQRVIELMSTWKAATG